jgi:hypothetical protein
MKTLHLINSNSSDKYFSTKNRIVERLNGIFITSTNSVDILEVIKNYFDLAEECVKNNILFYQAKKFILLGLLADCAGDDVVKAKINFEKYSCLDYTFESSRKGEFVKKLFKSIESNDPEELSFQCVEFDKIDSLNNIQVNFLSRIKKLINNGFDNDNDNYNDNYNDYYDNVNNSNVNIDEEIDLT